MNPRPYTGHFDKAQVTYKLKRGRGGRAWEVRLPHRVGGREIELTAQDPHDALIRMVNTAKLAAGMNDGGGFYINEHQQVLVPDGTGGAWIGGTYAPLLSFVHEGTLITPEPSPGLRVGQAWSGSQAGMKYTLTAGGRDIRRTRRVGPGREVKELLSDVIGAASARPLVGQMAQYKPAGGPIFLNERGAFFAQTDHGTIYLGRLDGVNGHGWFPAERGLQSVA